MRRAGLRTVFLLLGVQLLGCHGERSQAGEGGALVAQAGGSAAHGRSATVAADDQEPYADSAAYRAARQRLVRTLRAQGIENPRVLGAIGRVRRHAMVPAEVRSRAYADRPLPIGHAQTISQPFVVALMTQLADLEPGEKVLEVGTGSGYQAAVLAEMGAEVYSIEIVEPLGRRARRVLDALGYGERVRTRIGDGYGGWPSEAPFDAVLITAAPPEIPAPLKEQLAIGGKLVAPVGVQTQRLVVITRTRRGFEQSGSIPVRFVPMTGEAQREGR